MTIIFLVWDLILENQIGCSAKVLKEVKLKHFFTINAKKNLEEFLIFEVYTITYLNFLKWRRVGFEPTIE